MWTLLADVKQCIKTRKAPPAAPLFPWSWPTIPWQRINRLCHTSSQSLPCRCWCTLKVAWDYRSKEDHQLGGNNNHPVQQDMVSNSSYQRQRTTLSVFWIWRVPQTKRHTADISLTLTSSFQWISRKICSNLQVLLGIISLWSWFSASEDTELPTLIQEHPRATTGSSPSKLFLQRELRTRISFAKPDLASHVAIQQDKMKAYYDRQAKFREMAVGDTVLADDHLSSQKWQSGTVLGHKFPHSYQVQLDDGRIWKRHVDDVLQKKTPSTQTTAPRTASSEPTQANANVGDIHIQPAASAEPITCRLRTKRGITFCQSWAVSIKAHPKTTSQTLKNMTWNLNSVCC